jgi:hypothetical protein
LPLQHQVTTFYDELGVKPDAPPEEIRDAFRAMVRILHPDHQTDLQLKEIAERQMRKLNRAYSTLSDPDKRRRYNDSLENEELASAIILSPNLSVNAKRSMERIMWGIAFALVLGTLLWMSSDNPAASQSGQTAEKSLKKSVPAAPANVVSQEEFEHLRSELSLIKMERDAAIHEVGRLRASFASRSAAISMPDPLPEISPAVPLPAMTEMPASSFPAPAPFKAASTASIRPIPVKPAGMGARSFTGFWFYTRPAQREKSSTLYPPEFIEATISEQNGVVRGKYRSRYKIVDRAISPDVSFEFAGTSNGNTLACVWTGPGGSRGDLTLKITGENAMSVDWRATELGNNQGLVIGTATLTRRID